MSVRLCTQLASARRWGGKVTFPRDPLKPQDEVGGGIFPLVLA